MAHTKQGDLPKDISGPLASPTRARPKAQHQLLFPTPEMNEGELIHMLWMRRRRMRRGRGTMLPLKFAWD